jgi:hypothetical protein
MPRAKSIEGQSNKGQRGSSIDGRRTIKRESSQIDKAKKRRRSTFDLESEISHLRWFARKEVMEKLRRSYNYVLSPHSSAKAPKWERWNYLCPNPSVPNVSAGSIIGNIVKGSLKSTAISRHRFRYGHSDPRIIHDFPRDEFVFGWGSLFPTDISVGTKWDDALQKRDINECGEPWTSKVLSSCKSEEDVNLSLQVLCFAHAIDYLVMPGRIGGFSLPMHERLTLASAMMLHSSGLFRGGRIRFDRIIREDVTRSMLGRTHQKSEIGGKSRDNHYQKLYPKCYGSSKSDHPFNSHILNFSDLRLVPINWLNGDNPSAIMASESKSNVGDSKDSEYPKWLEPFIHAVLMHEFVQRVIGSINSESVLRKTPRHPANERLILSFDQDVSGGKPRNEINRLQIQNVDMKSIVDRVFDLMDNKSVPADVYIPYGILTQRRMDSLSMGWKPREEDDFLAKINRQKSLRHIDPDVLMGYVRYSFGYLHYRDVIEASLFYLESAYSDKAPYRFGYPVYSDVARAGNR